MVTTNMGNGTKFKLSNVLPNVFNKIKGIGPKKNNCDKKKGSGASPAPSECAMLDHTDINDFSAVSRCSQVADLGPLPVRVFPQNTDIRDIRHSSSPVHSGQKTYDICFPAESPVRSGGGKSRTHSPAPLRARNSTFSDPGCCSYEESRSTTALVPHVDGRVRRANPSPSFGRCSLMSKCNTFEGSTYSDSEVSDADTSKAHSRMRHARTSSVQLDRSSWPEGYGKLTAAVESARPRLDSASAPQRSRFRERREQNMEIAEHGHQLYGGSSPINHAAIYDSNRLPTADYGGADHTGDSSESHHGSACHNSSREETDLDHDQTTAAGSHRQGRSSRKLSFTTDDNAQPFDDTSFSSDDDFYNLRSSVDSKVAMGKYQLRSMLNKNKLPPQQQLKQARNKGSLVEPGAYASSTEVAVLKEDEKSHAAMLRREAVLAKTLLNASDGRARMQLSKFSHDHKPTRGVIYDGHDGKRDSEATYKRQATLVNTNTVLSAKDWARENLRALAKANEVDRETLARLRASQQDHHPVKREEDPEKEGEENMVEYQTFGLPPNSGEVFSRRISRHASPIIGEVEKHTEGRIDYRSSSPSTNRAIKPKESGSNFGYEKCARPVADSAGSLYKNPLTETVKSEKDLNESTHWDTEFPSFRSDSMLLGGGGLRGGGRLGSGRIVPEERAALIEFSECEVPAPRTPRYMERQRQTKVRLGQHQDVKSGNRSLSPRKEVTNTAGMKNFKLANQSPSPRRSQVHELSTRPKPSASPSSIQEFISRKKLSSRPLSPVQDISGKKISSRSPSPMPDIQRAKQGSTTSLARDRSSGPAGSAKKLNARAEAGMQRLDSVAVVKASYDPYHDFRESMVEMILENDIRTAKDLEDLLQCYLSLNSSDYHKIIVQVFTDIWGDIFEP